MFNSMSQSQGAKKTIQNRNSRPAPSLLLLKKKRSQRPPVQHSVTIPKVIQATLKNVPLMLQLQQQTDRALQP